MNTDKKTKLKHGIEVYKDGRVYQKRKKCSIGHEIFDSDMDLRIPMPPYVRYEWKNHWKRTETSKIDVEDLMAAAGYVDGNKSQFNEPVILHKDGDYLNNAASNLEWCEKTDPRYTEYYNRTVDAHNALGREYNKDWPEFKQRKKL